MELRRFCCICIELSEHLTSILQSDEKNIKYSEKLSLCDPNQSWENEELNLCRKCTKNLNLCYEFILCCKQSSSLRKDKLQQLQSPSNVHQCDICKKTYKQKRFLELHLKRIHPNTVDNKQIDSAVENINKEFPLTITDYPSIKGDSAETTKNPYQTKLDEQSSSNETIKKPRKPSTQESYTCSYCGKLFRRRQHWLAHIRSIHTFEKPYKCSLCDACFSNSHSLLVHNRNHNNEKPYICSTCGKGFVCSGDLNHHNKIHLNKREYQCNICDKRFNTSSILRTHKIVKHADPEEWKYLCTVCNRRFPLNCALAVHMKRHTGIKDFTCHICAKKFFNKSEVTKHIQTHSNERNFKCEHCADKEYKNREGLNKHLKIVHDIGNWKRPKVEKRYLCPMCPKMFSFNNKLQRHILSHTGDKPFQCHFCEKRFIDNYNRKLHLKKEHSININDLK